MSATSPSSTTLQPQNVSISQYQGTKQPVYLTTDVFEVTYRNSIGTIVAFLKPCLKQLNSQVTLNYCWILSAVIEQILPIS